MSEEKKRRKIEKEEKKKEHKKAKIEEKILSEVPDKSESQVKKDKKDKKEKKHKEEKVETSESEKLSKVEKDTVKVSADAKLASKFSDFDFPPIIQKVFSRFSEPTPIQSKCWPVCLKGNDLVGIAETGSGKTFAFAVPAVIRLLKDEKKKRFPTVLVLSPTRELAQQIQNSFEELCKETKLKSVVVYGGVSKRDQRAVVNDANIVVATPGRLLDLLNENTLDISKISYFVLDEADRMLDMGFERDVRKIFDNIKQSTQTLMFSATWPPSIQDMADKYLKNAEKITIGSVDLNANINVSQKIMVIDENQKDTNLLQLLKKYHSSRQNRVLIFALYKKEAERIENSLIRNGWKVVALHGDKNQECRNAAIESFRSGTCPLMVATDVAARGLDIPDVEYVINVTFPLTIEDYVHRIGRTGRGGKKGDSFTFFTPNDKSHSGSLINILKAANQPVPDNLLAFGSTVKKKEHKDYGAFYKPIDPNIKASHVKFDD